MEEAPAVWHLDTETREIGLSGVRAARKALRAACRDELDQAEPEAA